MHAVTQTRMDRMAFVVGLALAALVLLSWRVDGGTQAPPAEIELVTSSTGSIAVTPSGVTAERGRLRATSTGAGFTRAIGVTNATGAPLSVVVRLTPETSELDDAVAVRVAARGATLYPGRLGDLRRGSAPFALASHEQAVVHVETWIPESVPAAAWRARAVRVPVELATTEAAA